jgi:hypothetical protein
MKAVARGMRIQITVSGIRSDCKLDSTDTQSFRNFSISDRACSVQSLFRFINIRPSNPCTRLDRPFGVQQVEAHRFPDSRHMKVVNLSAVRAGRLYPSDNIPSTHFC